jgi:SHS2 domain-containing protein
MKDQESDQQESDRQESMRSEPAGEFREIEHTADLAIRVRGEDLVALFFHAAHGLCYLLRCRPADDPAESVERDMELDAPDLETLLVDWLDELLYLSQRAGLCFETFDIHTLDDKGHLKATVHASGSQTPRRDIKAVTFSDLRIVQQEDGAYETTVTFDV